MPNRTRYGETRPMIKQQTKQQQDKSQETQRDHFRAPRQYKTIGTQGSQKTISSRTRDKRKETRQKTKDKKPIRRRDSRTTTRQDYTILD